MLFCDSCCGSRENKRSSSIFGGVSFETPLGLEWEAFSNAQVGEHVVLCSMGAHMNGSGNARMPLHMDQWPLVPHPLDFPVMANTMVLVTDNSPENGGTRLIPGSHRWPKIDYKLANSSKYQDMAKSISAPKGSAIVWEGRVWHGNGLNRSGKVRLFSTD